MKKAWMFGGAALLSVPMWMMSTVTAYASTSHHTVYVSTTGSDTSGTGTKAKPYHTIQHAVDQAQPGSTVIVEPGTYHEQVTIAKPLTLESDPTKNAVDSTIVDAADPSTLETYDYTQGSGITLLQGATGSKVIGLTVEHASHAGILALGPLSNLTFKNNKVVDNAVGDLFDTDYEALHLVGVSNSVVEDNRVINNKDGGIYLTDETGPTYNNRVIHNMVMNNAVDCGITLASHGFGPGAGQGVYNNLLKDNLSIGNGAAGVVLATPSGSVHDNTVIGNIISANYMGGVVLHAHSPASHVYGNRIINNFISDNKPDGEVTGGLSVGISIGGEVSPVQDTLISNNVIGDQDVGIYNGLGTGTNITNSNHYFNVTTPVKWGD